VKLAYPQNSPAEDQWLDAEIKGSNERVMRALASAEMGRRQARYFTTACSNWTAQLAKVPDTWRSYVALAYAFLRFAGDAEFFAPKNNVDGGALAFGLAPRNAAEALLVAAMESGR
jgi:hypothetical protein